MAPGLSEPYLTAFECIPEALFVLSGQQIAFANSAARALFGREDLVGERIVALLDVPGGLAPQILRAREGKRAQVMARLHSPMKGAPLDLSGTLGAFDSGLGVENGLILCLQRATEFLRNERNRLEGELGRRAEELAEKNRQLEREIAERQEAEATLRSLSTPIIRVWSDVLALPVIGAVDHARATQMMERLLEEIVQTEATTAILDLTGVDLVDQETAQYLMDIAKAVKLLGSCCFLSGLSPAVARTMVEFGADVSAMETFGELEDALRRAIGRSPARALPRSSAR
jgi:rsbT co-antagonist protein RsbR